MTTFIVLAVVLTAMVTAWLVLPLLRGTAPGTVSSVQLNASIYRDHLANLERDFTNGQLDAAELEAARNELQLRLLEDTGNESAATPATTTRTPSKWTAVVIALLLPLGAGASYWWLGNPSAIDPQAAQVAGRAQIQKMVENLAAKQEANPDNLQGWAMLGRSYKVLGRMDDAVKAYAKAGSFVESNADLLVEYADVLALSQDSNLQGKPTELLAKALTLDPKNPMGLLMMGVSAYQREDYKLAIAHWDKLLLDLEPGSEDAQQVEGNIAQAKQRLAEKSAAKSTKKP
jgi:cytochrome c-type biogenesis protein CcmH